MSTYVSARRYACPSGHADPRSGHRLTVIVPDGSGIAPACTVCGEMMVPGSGPLAGSWEITGCCTPSGPGGTWAGPERDPSTCPWCCGTRRMAACTVCSAAGCGGVHDFCLPCDGSGRVTCPRCQGGTVLYGSPDEDGFDEGTPCPQCRKTGEVPCAACSAAEPQPGAAGDIGMHGQWQAAVRSIGDRLRDQPVTLDGMLAGLTASEAGRSQVNGVIRLRDQVAAWTGQVRAMLVLVDAGEMPVVEAYAAAGGTGNAPVPGYFAGK